MEAEQEESSGGVPEWVVTFGDMMSLLLTFFIMLQSMSEIKEEEYFKAVVDSIKQQFGFDRTPISVMPGPSVPQTQAMIEMQVQGRAPRRDSHRGGVPQKSPQGEEQRVRIVRQGKQTAIGTVLFFPDGMVELNAAAERALDLEAKEFAGRPQRIEIRGHTALQAVGQVADSERAMDLAYMRCRQVMRYLVQKHGIAPERVRLSAAGANEPYSIQGGSESEWLNPRVEVFLLDELTDIRGQYGSPPIEGVAGRSMIDSRS